VSFVDVPGHERFIKTMLMGVLATHPFIAYLTGDQSLRSRPMRRVALPLEEMGADLYRSPYTGRWDAACQGPRWPEDYRLRGDGDSPEDAVRALYAVWVSAGSPAPRLYTPEQSADLDVWCDSQRAAVVAAEERGETVPYPWPDRRESGGSR